MMPTSKEPENAINIAQDKKWPKPANYTVTTLKQKPKSFSRPTKSKDIQKPVSILRRQTKMPSQDESSQDKSKSVGEN